MPVTLKSAPQHAANRQAHTLETGTRARWKAAADHAPIRHVFRRLAGTHLSLVLLTGRDYLAEDIEGKYYCVS